MGTEGPSEDKTPPVEASGPAIPNLKALLKESLTEILRESPSLLHPPAEAEHGEKPYVTVVAKVWGGGTSIGASGVGARDMAWCWRGPLVSHSAY